jgi:REP element-mobilizing transposase RayT
MARGIAKRTIFECRADYRYFLSLLVRAVRRGVLELHLYALMQTHFHMLIRSPCGQLSRAMGDVLRGYARWFNRRRGRDGALFKEHFASKLAQCNAYRSVLVRYIDENAVKARLATRPADYAYGSAFHYARKRGPRWLERSWVEEEVKGVRGSPSYDARDYAVRFPPRLPAVVSAWIEDQLLRTRDAELVAPVETSQVVWMVRKAHLADGTEPFRLPLPPEFVEEEWRHVRVAEPQWPVQLGRQPDAIWSVLQAGLLRHACGLSHAEIHARTGAPRSTVVDRVRRHLDLMKRSEDYARRDARVIERVQERLRQEAHPHRYMAANAEELASLRAMS